jgi:hypothetical protein
VNLSLLGYRLRGKTAIRGGLKAAAAPERAALMGERSGAQSFEKRLNEDTATSTGFERGQLDRHYARGREVLHSWNDMTLAA